MPKDMPKEILTIKNIKEDLISNVQFSLTLVGYLIFVPLFAVISVIFTGIIELIFDLHPIIMVIIFAILPGFALCVSIKDTIERLALIIQITRDDFEITEDKIVDKLYIIKGYKSLRYKSRPYTFVLEKNGKYGLFEQKYYKWSNLYDMWEKGVYDSCDIGDSLYLIKVGKTKNIMVYNKKMFELAK